MLNSYVTITALNNIVIRDNLIMTSEERKEARYLRRKAKRELTHKELNKLYGNYEIMASFEELARSYYECKKGVNWKLSVQKYGAKLYINSMQMHNLLVSGMYKQRPFVEFDLNERGKLRHIKSVYITDRVVQKSLCKNCLVPMLSNSFIYDNGASLKGKGTLFAINRLTEQLRRHYRKYGTEGYIVLGDFKSYFDSLDHNIIYDIVNRAFDDKRILDLLKRMIEPFGAKGLGLGSQVCQILAVSYCNKLDHAITCKYSLPYGRYMDDFYIICKDKAQANEILKIVKDICKDLKLTLNENKTQIVKLSHGFTFLKTKFYLTDSGKVIRKITKPNIIRQRRRLKKFKAKVDSGEMTFEMVKAAYMSWRGYALKKDCYFSIKNMDLLFEKLFNKSIR